MKLDYAETKHQRGCTSGWFNVVIMVPCTCVTFQKLAGWGDRGGCQDLAL